MADPRQILGVATDAGPAEWKKAYRRLAMRWHPDRNTDPRATERFKEINAAYEALLAGLAELSADAAPAAPEEPSAEAESSTELRAADIRLSLYLTLEEGARGCRRLVVYQRSKACETCSGSGEAGIAKTRFCADCHGSGRLRGEEGRLVSCPACNGRGLFTERICPACAGRGYESAEARLEIQVPPGMLPGDELRLVGQGEPGVGTLKAGDLFLTVLLSDHALFARTGRDLNLVMPVSALTLMAGGEIEVPTLFGRVRHRLLPGPPVARQSCLSGLGYPGRGPHLAGDLLLDLQPVFPAMLDKLQTEELLALDARIQAGGAYPELIAWQAHLSEKLDR